MDKQRVYSYQVSSWLRDIAASKPEGYVYDRPNGGSCVNVLEKLDDQGNETREPSCIVGTLFIEKLGVDIKTVPVYGSAGNLVGLYSDKFEFSERAKALLRVAQVMQDDGVSWTLVAQLADALVSTVAGFRIDEYDDEFPEDEDESGSK